MRYSEPSAAAAVDRLRALGARRVTLPPLYPHWSGATTGSSVADFVRTAERAALDAEVRMVRAWGDDAGYVALLVEQVMAAQAALRRQWAGPIHLLFSAHGLPVRYITAGDPYPGQVEETARAVAQRVAGFAGWRLSYQSRLGPVKWLQPSTDVALRGLAGAGAKALVVVPLGFVSDHIETLYDLDVLYRDEARALGIEWYERVPSFNASPSFARVLADIVTLDSTVEAPAPERCRPA